MRLDLRLRTCHLALAMSVAVTACAHEPDVQTLLERYFLAHDDQAATFCGCFHELIGYADGDTCADGREFDGVQRGCITGIFDRDPDDERQEFSSAPALECMTAVDSDYAACMRALACDDLEGLDACIEQRNEALLDCPRLSEDDTEDFEQCLLL